MQTSHDSLLHSPGMASTGETRKTAAMVGVDVGEQVEVSSWVSEDRRILTLRVGDGVSGTHHLIYTVPGVGPRHRDAVRRKRARAGRTGTCSKVQQRSAIFIEKGRRVSGDRICPRARPANMFNIRIKTQPLQPLVCFVYRVQEHERNWQLCEIGNYVA